MDIVPESLGTVNVRVVLPDIPEHSKANCFEVSELSCILKPLSLVVIESQLKEVIPERVLKVPPRATEELPRVIELFCNCAFGILLVPKAPVDELYVSPEPPATLREVNKATVPPALGKLIALSAVAFTTLIVVSYASAPEPSKTIPEVPIAIALATPSAPAYNVVAVRDVKPAIVEAVAPNVIDVLPIVKELTVGVIVEAVVKRVPVSFGNVRVRSAVASAAVRVVSLPSAVDPSKTIFPLAIDIEFAASATPEIKVVEARDVRPAIVDAVAPKAIAVPPTVTELLAN